MGSAEDEKTAEWRKAPVTQAAAGGDEPSSPLWAGRYRPVRLLGEGGMGEVHLAIDTRRNGLEVAIKRMFTSDPKGIVRLKREYRRMEGFGHPNLVTLYGLDVHRGRPFIVMEYVAGVDFYSALRRDADGMVEIAGLRTLLRQLTQGLLELHERGRIHRDLKGSNVLVTEQGRVVILDFGLVNEIDRRTLFTSSMGKVEGTLLYMSPEQGSGLSSEASDWYALGVMLYFAVTRRYPLGGTGYHLLLTKVSTDAPRASLTEPRVPPDLDDLIARLLHREPSQRASGLDVLAWCDQDGRPHRPERRPPPPPSSPTLVGRERQQLALARALTHLLRKEPLRVDIAGPSGTGKTALLRDFLAPLRHDPDFVVLEGRCHEYDGVPFKAFDGLLDSLGRYLRWLPRERAEPLFGAGFRVLSRLFPTLAQARRASSGADAVIRGLGLDEVTVDAQELRQRAFVALRGLLHRIAASSRLILAVDDLHWGDVDSARLLSELMAPPGAPPLLFVSTHRTEDSERSPILRELARLQSTTSRQHEAIVVRTAALDREPAIELASRLLGRTGSRAQAEAVAREGQGNPMLMQAIARYLGEPGVALEKLVAQRLARLGGEAGCLLELVAVAGQPTPLDLLASAAGLGPDLRAVVAQLRADHFIRTSKIEEVEEIESYHQRISRAVLERLSPAELGDRHRRLAAALEAQNGGLERRAYHWFAAGELQRAGEAALSAADAAFRVCAFGHACALYQLALRCVPNEPGLRRKLARALVLAGRVVEAAPLLLQAAARASRPAQARELQREAGEHWMVCGQIEQGLAVLRPLLIELELGYPESDTEAQQQCAAAIARLVRRKIAWTERSELQLPSKELDRHDVCWALCKGHILTDLARGGLFAAEAAALALDLGEPRRIARSLALAGTIALERGEPVGLAWLKEAERIARKIGDAHATGFIAICRGLVQRGRGGWAQALEDLEFGLRNLPVGTAWEHALAAGSLLATLEALGDVATLAQRSRQLSQIAQDLGSARTYCLALTYSAWAALVADDTPRCSGRLAEVRTLLETDDYQIVHLYALKVAVEHDLYQGDAAAAWRRVAEEWPAIDRSRLLATRFRRFAAIGLRARAGLAVWGSGAPGFEHVPEVVLGDVAQLAGERSLQARPVSDLLRAGVAAIRRDTAEVRRSLALAIAGFDTVGMALHATCARRLQALWGATPEERAQLELAESYLRMQGVVHPTRLCAMLGPVLELGPA